MRRFSFITLAILALSIGLAAKGTTVFLGATLDTPPRVSGPIDIVRFDVLPPEWMHQAPHAMYSVQLARDAQSRELRLYLPGRGEAGYGTVNSRSVVTPCR